MTHSFYDDAMTENDVTLMFEVLGKAHALIDEQADECKEKIEHHDTYSVFGAFLINLSLSIVHRLFKSIHRVEDILKLLDYLKEKQTEMAQHRMQELQKLN